MSATQQKSNTCVETTEVVFLILGALIGAIGCLSRPDYNLPIFLFTYVITKYFATSADGDKDQLFCIILMAWSFGVDALFIIFVYSDIWESSEYKSLAGWEDELHTCSLVCCIINMIVKLCYILFKFFADGGKLWHGFKVTFCCCCVKG